MVKMTHTETLCSLCEEVKCFIQANEYSSAEAMIKEAMMQYADDPQPHNLMGILKEKEHDHVGAMRHLRAGYALDPSYGPVRRNLEAICDVYAKADLEYGEEEDVIETPSKPYAATYKYRERANV